jgi:hypothetical protein
VCRIVNLLTQLRRMIPAFTSRAAFEKVLYTAQDFAMG